MKLKKEYALLGIVILALGLYLFFNRQDQVHYRLPEPPPIETTDITRIEIGKAGATVTLERQEDTQWRLKPGDYPADAAQVERMLKTMSELQVTALVSETQSYARYDLDVDRKIEVRAYQGDELLRRFDIGKAASTFRHTHVRMGDDQNVYHAAGSFRWEFDKPVDELRDKTVFDVDRAAITKITLTVDDQVLVVQKAPPPPADQKAAPEAENAAPAGEQTAPAPEDRWVTPEGQAVAAVDQLLADLAPLKCSAFLGADQRASLTDPQYRLQLEGQATQTLEIFPAPSETPNEFAGISSDSPYPFKLTEFDVAKIEDFYKALTGTGDETSDAPEASP